MDKSESPPPEGEQALAQALVRNPALALRDAMLYTYYGTPIMAVPPVAETGLVHVRIAYNWSGLGDPMEVAYTIDITAADRKAAGTVNGAAYEGNAPSDKLAAVGQALTDLIPIQENLPALIPCTDNNPSWRVTLTYEGGKTVELTNNGSNLISAGGPWQATIDGQRYFQFSSAFLIALGDLVEVLEMPRGEPFGTYCHGVDAELIDELYP